MANASTSTAPSGPGYSYSPVAKAKPAPTHHLHGVARVEAKIPATTAE